MSFFGYGLNITEVIPMENKLMRITCDPVCGFMVQSHNEKEVIDMSKMHMKKIHKQKVTDKEARAMMEEVQ